MLTIRQFTFNPLDENTYVISDRKGACMIVDPGCYFGNERRELIDYVRSEGLVPKSLLNTHCHPDHVFGNKFIADEYGVILHIHPNEKPVLDVAPAMAAAWGFPFANYSGEISYFNMNEPLWLGDDPLELRFTPGHSPGSVSFYSERDGWVIAGDALFRDSIGRTDLPGGDHQTLLQSIRSNLFTLPDDTVVYPGHGPATTIGYEKANNPYFM